MDSGKQPSMAGISGPAIRDRALTGARCASTHRANPGSPLGERSNTGMVLPARSLWAVVWLARCKARERWQGCSLVSERNTADGQPDDR